MGLKIQLQERWRPPSTWVGRGTARNVVVECPEHSLIKRFLTREDGMLLRCYGVRKYPLLRVASLTNIGGGLINIGRLRESSFITPK